MIEVKHRTGSYPITFRPLEEAIRSLPEDSRLITDENVARHYGHALASRQALVLPAGESTKSFEHYRRCIDWLISERASRKTQVVALGGGVIGDLAGFVSASYMRGVPLIQIPTTLLAQVDSSVGGKVGIDLPQGKNLVGAFHPPVRVDVPIAVLQTLEDRQFVNGAAEVWKYAFIYEPNLLTGPLTKDSPQLQAIVERCIAIKAEVVEADELELTGERAILNFGHTVGHALEQVTGYGPILHGEAISIGMVIEARLGESLGLTEGGTAKKVSEALRGQGLPVELPAVDRRALVQAMLLDKKSMGGSLAFSLLERLGRCKLVSDVPREAVEASLF